MHIEKVGAIFFGGGKEFFTWKGVIHKRSRKRAFTNPASVSL